MPTALLSPQCCEFTSIIGITIYLQYHKLYRNNYVIFLINSWP